MSQVIFEDLQSIDYKKAWDYQQQVFNKIIDNKNNNIYSHHHHLLFCEHPHVYTLGKSGTQNNLLISEDFLRSIDATFYKIDRGGDITYHGPGQIVGYPIFDLEMLGIGIKEYIFLVEQSIIDTLNEYDIQSSRLEGAAGVWIDADKTEKARKICAIGVKASRYVSMHGFALNVNSDLNYFNHINPCGFIDKGVTSMEKEIGKTIDINEVKKKILEKVLYNFKISIK